MSHAFLTCDKIKSARTMGEHRHEQKHAQCTGAFFTQHFMSMKSLHEGEAF